MNPGERIVLTRDAVDRMVMMSMDLDRYEAQLIPDLQQQVLDLFRALRGLVAAADDLSPANRKEALTNARRVLAHVGSSGSGTSSAKRLIRE